MKDKQQDHGGAMTQGVVRKIDKEARTLTIKHGPIKNLGMPPMTMVFQTDDSVAIDQLETGQNIKFRAADMNGKMTVTEVEPAS
ncbi:copper-binding protein [Allohahella sp. A8]|uniref:copper-binding protein n=1 Tax=Allohahella sp. A8 TaxID=3141461 RepID=UPI003A806F8D